MRQFTPWAEAVGGFLAHHGVPGFLANVETVRDIDDEESAWTAFFARWRKIHGDKWLTSNELRLSADIPPGEPDPWDGCFITDGRGRFPTTKSLGKQLTGQINRYRGPFVLRNDQDKHSKVSYLVRARSGPGERGLRCLCSSPGAGAEREISRARAGNTPRKPRKARKGQVRG